MANLEGMPIGSLPEATDIQDEDEIVVYRPSTGKAYQANTDLIDSLGVSQILFGSAGAPSCPAGEITTIDVTFSTPFRKAPQVLVSMNTSSTSLNMTQVQITSNNITTTGFEYRVYNADSSTRAPSLRWLAIAN